MTDFASRVAAAADEMRKKSVQTEIRTEALPPEVRMVIEQLKAAYSDHEQRLVSIEGFQSALIREATSKLKDVA